MARKKKIDPSEEEGNDNPELGTLAEQEAAIKADWEALEAILADPVIPGEIDTPPILVEEDAQID